MTPRGKILWSPPPARSAGSALARFWPLAESRAGRKLADYAALHAWSVADPAAFWQLVLEFTGVLTSGASSPSLLDRRLPGARWFPDLKLNFAENLLRHRGDRTAIIFETEDESLRRTLSFDELRAAVLRCASAMRSCGVGPGDRVAAWTPNAPEAVIAHLAAAALGAIWSSASPDFGVQGVFDRFGQIAPRLLFAADTSIYAGKRHPLGSRVEELRARLPSVEQVILYSTSGGPPTILPGQVTWDDFLARGGPAPELERRAFDQPLAILYTSGTTGVPKCLVHSSGGVLLKHLEEHVLQVDLHAGDVFFYFTTCGWMMWNWLLTGLASGATLVLYDGSPLHPDPARLFRLAERNGITVFGTSPRYLSALEAAGLRPRERHRLDSLRTVLSTGAPLFPQQFEWVYRELGPDLMLSSISGGTDIVGCFVLGSPFHAVRAGEIPAMALGMDVRSLDEAGRAVVGRKGELACGTPFPSVPIGFWNDPGGARFHAAYFERFPGLWHHGDYLEVFEDGASVIHGRSDATLNPGGVRIGTAELYRSVLGVPGVREALAVGRPSGTDEEVVLFVVLAEGLTLGPALEQTIRSKIRAELSPRHVPGAIHQVPEVPRTVSGKIAELSVARVLRGEPVKNREALANPESLEAFRAFAR